MSSRRCYLCHRFFHLRPFSLAIFGGRSQVMMLLTWTCVAHDLILIVIFSRLYFFFFICLSSAASARADWTSAIQNCLLVDDPSRRDVVSSDVMRCLCLGGSSDGDNDRACNERWCFGRSIVGELGGWVWLIGCGPRYRRYIHGDLSGGLWESCRRRGYEGVFQWGCYLFRWSQSISLLRSMVKLGLWGTKR